MMIRHINANKLEIWREEGGVRGAEEKKEEGQKEKINLKVSTKS
jgi:hypothetical protein